MRSLYKCRDDEVPGVNLGLALSDNGDDPVLWVHRVAELLPEEVVALDTDGACGCALICDVHPVHLSRDVGAAVDCNSVVV